MKAVLFLCTGNYYRSRFAEELFNHRANNAPLDWRATSRALAIERGTNNFGAMSPYAITALSKLELVAEGSNRMPRQCSSHDLESANLIVALMTSEHRPLMIERFSNWADQAEYWDIGDVDVTHPDSALSAIEANVDALIKRLAHE